LVLELAYFTSQPRPGRALPAFFSLFVALPAVVVAISLLSNPGRLLGSYVTRDFTLYERIVSEPRALMEYIGLLLLPRNPQLGLFTDDFAASTGVLAPPSTLLAILGLLAISGFAIAIRKRAPSIFAGWFFFLVAHAVESTILPLELYFEHRNYLPAFGLWLAVAGLCELATRNIQTNVLSRRQLGFVVSGGFILVFAFSTLGRARVWQQPDTIVAQALVTHPTSQRANLASIDIAVSQGNYQQAVAALDRLKASPNPRDRMMGMINKVTIDCIFGLNPDPDELAQATRLAQPKALLADLQAFEMLAKASNEKGCGAASAAVIADSIDTIVDAATAQPDSVTAKWRLRLVAARLYGQAGRWAEALAQAKLAWQHNADAAAGGYLAIAYAENGLMPEAERIYSETKARLDPYKSDDIAGLAAVRAYLDGHGGKDAKPRADADTSAQPPAH
jgi:tetratricopeptide (TPR) repeat protein